MGKHSKHGRRGNGDGTIYERPNGTYAATFTIEGGKRKTLYAKTYKEAKTTKSVTSTGADFLHEETERRPVGTDGYQFP